MANTKSAKKRVEVSKRNRLRNLYYKTSLKNLIKSFLVQVNIFKNSDYDQNLQEEKQKDLRICLSNAYRAIDKSVKNKAISKRTGARKKSRLFKHLKKIETIETEKKDNLDNIEFASELASFILLSIIFVCHVM